jgi:hypothetical protein
VKGCSGAGEGAPAALSFDGVNVPERVEATIQQIDPQDVSLIELINETRAEAAVAEEQVWAQHP